MSSSQSLCFLDAAKLRKEGRITDDEYYDHLLAHRMGAEHPGDEDEVDPTHDRELKEFDLFAYSVRLWTWGGMLGKWPLKDVSQYKRVFTAYSTGTVEKIDNALNELPKEDVGRFTESVAILALRDKNKELLRHCLDRGWGYSAFFTDAADEFERNQVDPEIVDIFQKSKMRQHYPWPVSKPQKHKGEGNEDLDPADFDRGGEYPVDW